MPSSTQPTCPHCGAKVSRDWQSCWLCGQELPANLSAATAGAGNLAERQSAEGPVKWVIRLVGGVIAFALALILIGLVADRQFGGVVALVLLLLPAGLVTLTKTLKRRSQGADLTTLEKLGTFAMSLAVTVGAIVALGVAACVAFFVICLGLVTTGGFR
ncbi:MAG: hypothetical protein ACT4QC_22735 [Planctomycetaceae bacterium]